MEELLAKKSFVRWIKGTSTIEEKEYWESWLTEEADHRRLVREASEIMSAFNEEYEIPDPQKELDQLNRKIERNERTYSAAYERQPQHFGRKAVSSIAAGIVLVIAVLAGSVAYKSNSWIPETTQEKTQATQQVPIKEYNTDYGEKLTFRLSDGSSIVLNANSSLKFSSKIEKGLNTEVWLQGEAYFDIVHLEGDRQRTFTVHTDNGSIQVLGTRFAVNTFRGKTQTVLEKGKVHVQAKGEKPDNQPEYFMEAGEMAKFTAFDNKIAVKKVNTCVYTSWKEDKLIFKKTSMKEVANRIEDTFGIEVVVNKGFADEVLSGSIKSGNLKVLAEALERILEAQIKQQKGKLFIGTS